jgi:membrane protein
MTIMIKQAFIDLIHAVLKHNIGTLAAVISFFGFSSLVPVLALLVFVSSLIVPEIAVDRFMQEILQSYVPAIPMAGSFAAATITRLATLGAGIGLIGLASLLWSTIGGFVTLQQTLDMIFEVKKRRSFLKQYIMGFAMMGVLLALTVFSSLLSIVSPKFITILTYTHAPWLGLFHLAGQIMFPLILFVTCYCCYRILPSYTLKTIPLLVGSALATLFIYISRYLFVIYTHHLRNYELMYGTLTFVMLLTFWIYIVCVIVLISAEISVITQKYIAQDSD